MNKSIINIFLRSFASKASSGIRGRLRISRNTSNNENFDDIDDTEDDLDLNEGDFMNADKAHSVYERETNIQKEMLRRRIVMSKYFNRETEPNFLTFIESRQIRALHESDPEEWTVNRLSNSFPVLPETVKKILRSKWQPNSTYQILKYDKNVMENWKNFRAGKLAVSYPLKVHLMKFKNRKISTMGREELAVRFVPQKFEIPEPQSKTFVSIAQECTDNRKSANSKHSLLDDKGDASKNAYKYPSFESNVQKEASFQFSAIERVMRMGQSNNYDKRLGPIRFNEFIDQKIDELYYESPRRQKELLEKSIEYEQENTIDQTLPQDEKLVHSVDNKTANSLVNSLPVSSTEGDTCNVTHTSQSFLHTFIKARKKKIPEPDDYTIKIKIPKHLHQKGMTYKIKDCYYDDDGEFLYRVIGM